MPTLGVIEDTLWIPMLGRIYASEQCPQILSDPTALSLKDRLPPGLQRTGSQYALLAPAVRCANLDRAVQDFLRRNPDGSIVQLGCGLETACFRNDNGVTRWYAVDLPHVIACRQSLLPEPERETCLAGDAFDDAWLRHIRAHAPQTPLLVTAGGLLHYFSEEKVLGLFHMLGRFGPVELVFDAVNKQGLAMMRRKYMKQLGHPDARMFFHVDAAAELAARTGSQVLSEEGFYRHTPKKGLHWATKCSMSLSDRLCMVKMIHLKW